jgi:hypothetical protein
LKKIRKSSREPSSNCSWVTPQIMFFGLDNPRSLMIYAAVVLVVLIVFVAVRFRWRE